MSDLNRSLLVGRFTKDPELKYTGSGAAVCSFTLANNKTWVVDGEKKERTSFINCVAWKGRAETIAEYCKKGDRFGVEGRLEQRSWDDSEGNKRYSTELIVENFQFLQGKREGAVSGGQEVNNAPPANYGENPFSDNDIPF